MALSTTGAFQKETVLNVQTKLKDRLEEPSADKDQRLEPGLLLPDCLPNCVFRPAPAVLRSYTRVAAATIRTAKTHYMLAADADGSCHGTTTTCTGTTWQPQPLVGIAKPPVRTLPIRAH